VAPVPFRGGRGEDPRLEKLEKALESIQRELESLRRDLNRQRRGAGAGAGAGFGARTRPGLAGLPPTPAGR